MSGKTWVILVAVFAWLATAAITVTVFTVGPIGGTPRDAPAYTLVKEEEPLPRYDVLPVFELTDQQGHAFGLNDLRGKVWAVDTFFTRCVAICPTLTGGMRDLQSALEADTNLHDDVRLVSISVDGGHDTPEVMATFANAYQADDRFWKFLTGDRGEVWPLVEHGMKLNVGEGPPGDEDNIDHSGKILLIDRVGVIRGYYDGMTEAGRIELWADLRRLVNEE